MCLEDIRIGLKKRTVFKTVSIGAGAKVEALRPSRLRTRVEFQVPNANSHVHLVVKSDAGTTNTIEIRNGNPNYVFTLEEHGTFVFDALDAFNPGAGASSINIIETFYDDIEKL